MPGFFRAGLVWLHVLGTVVWIGGLLFQLLVIRPTLIHMPVTAEWLQFRVRLDRSFRAVMWSAVGVVLLTGLFNVIMCCTLPHLPGVVCPPRSSAS
jgi:uncharacterized membrane protein